MNVTILDNIIYVNIIDDDTIEATIRDNGPQQSAIQFDDEGIALGTIGTVNEVDFTGAGVTGSRSGGKVTYSIPGGSGGVTSIADFTPLFTVTNRTTTPVFVAVNQTANLVYAGPASGGADVPIFRALVAADIPSLTSYWGISGSTTVTTPTITGTVTFAGTAHITGDAHVGNMTTHYAGFNTLVIGGSNTSAALDFVNNGSIIGEFFTTASMFGFFSNTNVAINFYSNNDLTAGHEKISIVNTGVVMGGNSITSIYAILDLQSTTQAFIPPRMTKTQRNAMTVSSGMVVHQTDNTPGLREYNGTNWVRYTETTD